MAAESKHCAARLLAPALQQVPLGEARSGELATLLVVVAAAGCRVVVVAVAAVVAVVAVVVAWN